jgi:hypothetical protein
VDELEIVHVPRTRAYVREFSGFATEGQTLDEAVRLRADLLADEVRPRGWLSDESLRIARTRIASRPECY